MQIIDNPRSSPAQQLMAAKLLERVNRESKSKRAQIKLKRAETVLFAGLDLAEKPGTCTTLQQ